jgi:hypothetical protein
MSYADFQAVSKITVGSSTDKLVLLTLAFHADKDTRRCWPSIADLCAETCLSARAVRYSAGRLAAAGHIGVVRRHRRSSIFTLHLAESRVEHPRHGECCEGCGQPEQSGHTSDCPYWRQP